MRLLHYTEEPLVFDPTRSYDQDAPHGFGKPVGLWVSVEGEDDWKSWCEAEEHHHLAGLTHVCEVVLTPGANVLLISTGEQLEVFHERASIETDYTRDMAHYGLSDDFARRQWPIDWAKVIAEYDGILIAPYLWSHRLTGPSWYYGWDCASGCIWGLDAIALVKPE